VGSLARDPLARLRRVQVESIGTTINFRPAVITNRDIAASAHACGGRRRCRRSRAHGPGMHAATKARPKSVSIFAHPADQSIENAQALSRHKGFAISPRPTSTGCGDALNVRSRFQSCWISWVPSSWVRPWAPGFMKLRLHRTRRHVNRKSIEATCRDSL
jgi:hypothetical protein